MSDNTLVFLLLDMVVIIVAARTLGWLVGRVGQPAVVGEILAGILLGPSVLGHIDPAAPAALFPADVPLDQIANLGLIFFMFLVGLELDPRLMRAQGRRAVEISLSGIVAPFVLGIAIGTLLVGVNQAGAFQAGTRVPPTTLTFSLFIGAAMCITAFPVLARILVESGLYKTAIGTATLCAAAVDDVVAWILLAAVVGIARTGSLTAAAGTLLLALAFAAFMFLVARRLLERLARHYDRAGHLSVNNVAIVLAGVLLSAAITQRIGIHAIFGAFIFGAIMPKRSGMTRELTDKVEDFAVIVLLPVFFAVSGLRTNVFAINSVSLLGWLLLILVIATAGKFAGCGLAARLTGSSARDSLIIGGLMNTRGLTELVILSIGYSLGVLSDRTYAMMVVMALATTVLAAPLVNRLLPRDQVRRELGQVAAAAETAAVRILVALGNPLNGASLVDAGIRLTGVLRPAELLLVRLIPSPRAPEFRTGLLDEETQIAASVESMRQLVEQAAAAGVRARPISFISSDVGRDISRLAADQECDLILLGWLRASLPRHVIKALVRRVFSLAPCTVAVFVDRMGRGIPATGGAPVVVSLNGGSHDDEASHLGAGLAASLGTSIRLIGYAGGTHAADTSESVALALRADRLRQQSGTWVVPEYVESQALSATLREPAGAAVAVAGAGADWRDSDDFGQPTAILANETVCPLLVVHAAGRDERTYQDTRAGGVG